MKFTSLILLATLISPLTAQCPTTTASWQELAPSSSPEARAAAAMAYSLRDRASILYGGRANGAVILGDTWRFARGNWTRVSADSAPGARWNHAMTYDPRRGEIVMFGGRRAASGNSTYLNDTWVFRCGTWTRIPTASAPSPRISHAMAYDARSGRVLLFGGEDPQGVLGDTWAWNGRNWRELQRPHAPAPRSGHGMISDLRRGGIVLFGGHLSTNGLSKSNETWVWNGRRWRLVNSVSTPTARAVFGSSYDLRNGKVLIFGGYGFDAQNRDVRLDETWAFDGREWQELPAYGPGPRYQSNACYDLMRGITVRFGGNKVGNVHQGDTWVLRLR